MLVRLEPPIATPSLQHAHQFRPVTLPALTANTAHQGLPNFFIFIFWICRDWNFSEDCSGPSKTSLKDLFQISGSLSCQSWFLEPPDNEGMNSP